MRFEMEAVMGKGKGKKTEAYKHRIKIVAVITVIGKKCLLFNCFIQGKNLAGGNGGRNHRGWGDGRVTQKKGSHIKRKQKG